MQGSKGPVDGAQERKGRGANGGNRRKRNKGRVANRGSGRLRSAAADAAQLAL